MVRKKLELLCKVFVKAAVNPVAGRFEPGRRHKRFSQCEKALCDAQQLPGRPQ